MLGDVSIGKRLKRTCGGFHPISALFSTGLIPLVTSRFKSSTRSRATWSVLVG